MVFQFERFGHPIAFQNTKEGHLSYQQLAEKCDAFKARLACEKSLIMVHCDHSIASLIAIFGSLRAGHAVMLADAENDHLIEALKQSYTPDYIYHPQKDDLEKTHYGSAGSLYEELALLISTSGSTGSPKTVRLSYEGLTSNAEAIADYLPITASDRALLTLPVHYCYGLSVVTSHLLKGATIIVEHTEINEKDFYDKLKSERVTTFPCVPFHFDLFERIGFRQWDLPDLNYITQAGGALAPHLAKTYAAWAKETDKEFFIMYGATEATARMAYLPSRLAGCHSDTIGQPVSNGQFHLLNPQGDLIEEVGEEGELVYTGPNVMLGYAQGREDLSKGRDSHQLHTGDMALKTADGLYKITGRISRFAKLYGKRFNLQDIENTLSAHGVTGAAFSDDRSLFVATRQKDSHRLIVDLITEHFGIAPQDIKTREYQDLPTLSSGKIHYQALQEDFARQEKEKASLPTPQKSQKQALLDLYAETFLTEVSEEDSFRSLEGDSLRFIQISLGIEKIIGHLPQGWEDKPISALSEGQSKVKSKWLAEVETNVLIRVGAILLVLCNHGGAHFLKGGAHILLMVSAFNFVRFQYPQILQGKVKPFLSNFLINVLIPYWGIILIYGLYRSNISWADIFLYRNIIGAPGSPGFGTWFIEVMVQGFFILILLSQVKGIKSQYQKHPFSVAMALLCLAIMMRIGHEMVFGVYKEPTWMFPFTAVLWVFMFGVVMAHAETTRQKVITTGLLALSVYLLHEGQIGRPTLMLVAASFLIWVPRMKMPRMMVPLLLTIGSAALFIYMLNERVVHIAKRFYEDLPLPFPQLWETVALWLIFGILFGVIGYKLYNILLLQGKKLFKRKQKTVGVSNTTPLQ